MEKLNQILNNFMADGDSTKDKVLGASFIVTDKNKILYEGVAGRIGNAVDSPSFSSESSGWIASMTKIVTATSLMQLFERGLIHLDDDARSLVPELANVQILRGFNDEDKPVLENNTDPITLRQLLCHTSGMGYDAIDADLQKWSSATGRTAGTLDQTREGWNTPLKFRPGESWQYGSSLDWAGQVLEKITGQSLGEYMSENIFKPLGMTDTTFRRQKIAEKVSGRIIESTYRIPDGTLIPGPLPVSEDPPLDGGGAGLFSTAQDYIKFLQAVVAAGEGQGTLLRKETVDEMFRPQLSKAQRQKLQTFLKDAMPFPPDTPMDHGISGAINTADLEGKRKKGTLTWGGMSNGQWWIDREIGIAAVLFVSLLPPYDESVKRLYDELERVVYGDLLPRS
ncbi:beta-lactamase/transpeptidase-like protein [Ilyonectria robusta]|uniref:beta-lactamase/transpeptidase-like protein n=1 Tax=Ilyonectria robusta TaxID=1079257 RepID=UPI001E8CE9C1|nr:beta-lactamase/transpeptidase-like protein [Ilyonectria robusta]KAH8684126.1 beta-lactamase/transpeptidase-like protein [Ilyonectria robusta]